ncbi:MAG: hypothetical protein BWY09_02429 [Candidatus Hydrogenedentes bacterium ADurb.Bin179]|nr:MAG: hypothetical protein BWY09_02429 [Candidatus Hydrogenedentes bacterium ADurb.Bin179]
MGLELRQYVVRIEHLKAYLPPVFRGIRYVVVTHIICNGVFEKCGFGGAVLCEKEGRRTEAITVVVYVICIIGPAEHTARQVLE